MIAIVDYGVGNLFSVASSLKSIGADAYLAKSADDIKNASSVILPGVGAFRDARAKLLSSGMTDAILDAAKSGKPLLGICLGMQLLLEKSFEFGEYDGLSLINGNVRPISDVIPKGLKIPHIGWNALELGDSPLFKYIKSGDYVYFVHSYFCADCDKNVIATTDYGAPLTAAVQSGNVYGVQFHPEKSGDVGLNILRAFCEIRG